jgi:pimeloyl-ACP methyl ester carboxylesterase
MEKKFQYQGSEIHYTVVGEGVPVVLLHGFAEDSTIWTEQIPILQQNCQLLVPDLPGSGKSKLLTKENVTIEDYAECINALLGFENITKCILLGHSMGGYIAIGFAEMYPDKLAAFGFIHSTAFADSEDKKITRRKAIELIEEFGVYPFLKNTTPNLFSKDFKKEHPERVSGLIEQGKQFSKEALIQYYAAMISRPDRTHVLEKTLVPVLFIIGSEDVAAPLEDLLKQVHLPKISFIHILQSVGHMSMWEKPAELNNHLLKFIKTAWS